MLKSEHPISYDGRQWRQDDWGTRVIVHRRFMDLLGLLVILEGCGTGPGVFPAGEPAGDASAALAGQAPVVAGNDGLGVDDPTPLDSRLLAPPPAGGAFWLLEGATSTPFDPIGLASLGSDEASALTSLWLDQLVLESLEPSGPALNLTFLERLCLAGDDPDFFCHQRYGQ